MPHSSGGGSHGGGSHGGHSSSHGGSRGRGSSISRTPFAGSRRYVYYHRNRPQYFYASKSFKPGFNASHIFIIVIYLFFIVMILSTAKNFIPHVPQNYNHIIKIEDDADVITNEDALKLELERFKEKTGITPSVVTIHNEDWQSENYYNLERYAYNRYLSEFDDEMHWLIVYSEPKNGSSAGFNDWCWEGMQGDNTDSLLTPKQADKFNSYLQSKLESGEDAGTSLQDSFAYFTKEIHTGPNFSALYPVAPMLLFILIHAFGMFFPVFKYRNAVPDPNDQNSSAAYPSSGASNGSNTSVNSSTPNSYGNNYGNTPHAAPSLRNQYNTPTGYGNGVGQQNKPYDPQAARRQRIASYDKNYSYAEYKRDKEERDREFNSYIEQYKQLMPENKVNTAPQMDSLNVPAPSAAPSSGNLVTCQYCGNVFASKYNKCPFCNARRSDNL